MMRRGLWIAVAVVVVIVFAGLLVVGSYISAQKQMVAKQEAVAAQWANVQSVLQRRADLIPNLVATVKGYATHEEAVFADVDKARTTSWTARSVTCWPSPKTTPTSRPTKTSCSCRIRLKAPRIASMSSANATTRPCRTTTPSSSRSRTTSGRASAASSGILPTSKPARLHRMRRRCTSSRSQPAELQFS